MFKKNPNPSKMHTVTFPVPFLGKIVKGPKTYKAGITTPHLAGILLIALGIMAKKVK